MDSDQQKLKKELDAIPQVLKDKFVPVIENAFQTVFAAAANQSGQPDRALIEKALQDFLKDGGTEDQWNILAPAVHYGSYGKLQR